MEPLFLEPEYKHNIWGGFKISQDLKNIPKTQIAESWEVAANKNGNSTIKNGDFKGKTLMEVFGDNTIRVKIFGSKCKRMKKFPLLVKFIDAKENLSLQVHPNNFYAKILENDTGKTELWHILDCEEDAKIICGLKEDIKTKKDFDNLKGNDILEHLNYIPIQVGDSIFIKAGTVHAIMANTLICEVQQNSDITYRVYDWGRNDKKRPLHIEKSRKVIGIKNKAEVIKGANNKNKLQKICHQKFFNIDKIDVQGSFAYASSCKTFQIINILKGKGIIICNGKEHKLVQGTSLLIPAMLGEYALIGNLEVLMTYIGKQ